MIEDLLIEFDEMGFIPATLCQNPEKYAVEWKKRLVAEIDKLQKACKSEWVHLPCKVFDDVYLIHNGAIEKCVVEGIHYTKKSSYVRLRPYHQDYLGNWSKYFTPSLHSFAKTIFPTREEAEKALAERSKNNEQRETD